MVIGSTLVIAEDIAHLKKVIKLIYLFRKFQNPDQNCLNKNKNLKYK